MNSLHQESEREREDAGGKERESPGIDLDELSRLLPPPPLVSSAPSSSSREREREELRPSFFSLARSGRLFLPLGRCCGSLSIVGPFLHPFVFSPVYSLSLSLLCDAGLCALLIVI